MTKIHYADPHFPVICKDVVNAGCCAFCHDVDNEGEYTIDLPFAIWQDEDGLLVDGYNAPRGAFELGFACCTSVPMTKAAVIGVLARHVIDSVDGCPMCELSRTLK